MITRPPPPSGHPPMYAVAGRAFGRTNLRPVVIGSCIAAIVWSLVWASGAFEDTKDDNQTNEFKKLVPFDITLGSLYAGVAVIEFFGLFAAVSRRLSLARIFVGLSFLVAVIVAAAELLRTVVHFTLKNVIVDECIQDSQGDTVRTSFGFWGSSTRTLSREDAQDFCNSSYNRMSFSTIAWLILATLLALFFASTAYAFYRQLLDPNSFRAPRAPSDQVRLDAMRHQQQPYGGGYVPYPGFTTAPTYAPPAGPPPGLGGHSAPPYEGGRLPEYGTDFSVKDKGDEKEKDDELLMGAQHQGLGAGPSEVELGTGYHV